VGAYSSTETVGDFLKPRAIVVRPAAGSQEISPATLEAATGIPMEALTPQSNNAFTWAGVAFAVAEGCLSLATGINLNVLVGLTLLLVAFDQLLLNGGLFETALKTLFPEYRAKVLRHEAGHFLIGKPAFRRSDADRHHAYQRHVPSPQRIC